MIYRLVVKKMLDKRPTERQNFLWNMIGSGIYSLSSMILSLFVIKIVGAEQGGIFSIALTLSQMLVYIAYFEMRTFQVTDSKNEFGFSEYHGTKIILCVLMMLFSCGYTVVQGYELKKSVIIILVCLARCFDGYADVYEAHFQKEERLDLAGKSLAYRTILFVSVLLVSLLLSKELILSLVLADFIAVIGLLVFDMQVMQGLSGITCMWKIEKIKKIVIACFPLFVGTFCWTYILSASRMAIDGNMASEYQSYYQVIFMPVSVINLFAGFVFRPMLPKLAENYNSKKYKLFTQSIMKGVLGIGVITIVCMLGAWVIGIPVLSMMSGCDLSLYRGVLVFLIFAGGFNAIAFTMYYVLTIMRCAKSILIDYVLAALLALGISQPMVVKYGIQGAAWSYFIVVLALCFLFCVSIGYKAILNKKGRI